MVSSVILLPLDKSMSGEYLGPMKNGAIRTENPTNFIQKLSCLSICLDLSGPGPGLRKLRLWVISEIFYERICIWQTVPYVNYPRYMPWWHNIDSNWWQNWHQLWYCMNAFIQLSNKARCGTVYVLNFQKESKSFPVRNLESSPVLIP